MIDPARPCRVVVLGATGTVGQAVVRELVARGAAVTCLVRRADGVPAGAAVHIGAVADPAVLAAVMAGTDAVVSCLASRTGAPADAWAVDRAAHSAALAAAIAAGVGHFVLVSAICVQKPRLAFQHAKLAFEAELRAAPLTWTIVRPTTLMKSLSGQVDRVTRGRPYLIVSDGTLTATAPIADADLAAFVADCLDDPARWNAVLPVGGPGPALTPRQQGEALFTLLGRPPRFRRVPVALLDTIVGGLNLAGRISPALAAKAELARIGRYYATESMLVWDERAGRYDDAATPRFGTVTLADHFAALLRGEAVADRGDHAVF